MYGDQLKVDRAAGGDPATSLSQPFSWTVLSCLPPNFRKLANFKVVMVKLYCQFDCLYSHLGDPLWGVTTLPDYDWNHPLGWDPGLNTKDGRHQQWSSSASDCGHSDMSCFILSHSAWLPVMLHCCPMSENGHSSLKLPSVKYPLSNQNSNYHDVLGPHDPMKQNPPHSVCHSLWRIAKWLDYLFALSFRWIQKTTDTIWRTSLEMAALAGCQFIGIFKLTWHIIC